MAQDAAMSSVLHPVNRRIHTTAAQRRDWISRLQRSGLDLPSFARRHGLVLSSLQRWHRQVGAAPDVAPLPVFHEVALPGLLGPKPWAAEWQFPDGRILRLDADLARCLIERLGR